MKDTPRVRERGAGNVGCLFVIVLFAVIGYGAFRIVPVYWEQDNFHDELLVIAGKGTVERWNDRIISRQVMALAKNMNFDVEQGQIRVERVRDRPEIIVILDYSRTLDFPGDYQHTFEFHTAAAGNLGW
ncbi:MAG: hypothetical protein V3R94_07405 [Acidobacteriota bacterium]